MRDRATLIERAIKKSLQGPELPDIRLLAVQAIEGAADHDDLGQAKAIYSWIKTNIRYVEDPAPFDLYASPLTVWAWGAGDCDDHTILGSALFSTIGFHTGCRVIGTANNEWHVYGLLWKPKGSRAGVPIPFDTTWPKALQLGDEYPSEKCVYRQSWGFAL